MATMQTGCVTGGVKKSSGVSVQEDVSINWAKVRDDSCTEMDWILCSFEELGSSGNNKQAKSHSNNIITILKGSGGVEACGREMPTDGRIIFGGSKILSTGRFVHFMYVDLDNTPAMLRGRASMFKNGVLNVLEGCDCEIEMRPGIKEGEVTSQVEEATGGTGVHVTVPKTKILASPAKKATPLFKEEKKKSDVGMERTKSMGNTTKSNSSSAIQVIPSNEQVSILSYALLKSNPNLPGVDPKRKELSLSNNEFKEVFGMEKDAFLKLAHWKQVQKKKQVGLF